MTLVLRICAPYSLLSREDCACPDRCQERDCAYCGQPVHYDPKAAIPVLSQEVIVCVPCVEEALS